MIARPIQVEVANIPPRRPAHSALPLWPGEGDGEPAAMRRAAWNVARVNTRVLFWECGQHALRCTDESGFTYPHETRLLIKCILDNVYEPKPAVPE